MTDKQEIINNIVYHLEEALWNLPTSDPLFNQLEELLVERVKKLEKELK